MIDKQGIRRLLIQFLVITAILLGGLAIIKPDVQFTALHLGSIVIVTFALLHGILLAIDHLSDKGNKS